MCIQRIVLLALILFRIAHAASAEPIAIVGGTVHTVVGKDIKGGTVLFDETGILAVAKQVDVPQDARTIDATGRHVYPGLISAYSQLGLTEIDAVRATRDFRETGSLNPNAMAHKAVNPDSELIPVARSNGILLNLVAPSGGRISGQSSLMQLAGWTGEEMLVQPALGLHVRWSRDEGALRELADTLRTARAYRSARQARDSRASYDIRLEALLPLIAGEQPMVVDANREADITAAVAFAQHFDLKLIIFGGYDAPRCAALLREYDVPVIVSAVYRLPQRRGDAYDAAYTLPNRLREAGVSFCIGGDGSTPSNLRNLPYHAATAAAYGLPRDEALRAITKYPAEILGVADRFGSLEKGKQATLFITAGDPLETPTQVEMAFIAGHEIDLNDRHKRLYEKYRSRGK